MSDAPFQEPTVSTINAPQKDGDVKLYVHPKAAASPLFNRIRRVIFINGIANSPEDHRASCYALSLLQFCPVIGVYNASGRNGRGSAIANTTLDILQCLTDKSTSFEQFRMLPSLQRTAAVEGILAVNSAALKLFRLIRPRNKRYDIHAHSQGNYIVSNTLSAIRALDGAEALAGRTVYSYGSPCGGWPGGVRLISMEFSMDPVSNLFQITSLDGLIRSFSGEITKVNRGCTHAFLEYVKHNPEFVLKRLHHQTQEAWDPIGLHGGKGGWVLHKLKLIDAEHTPSLDSKALASWARQQGNNYRRVHEVFQVAANTYRPYEITNLCHHYMNRVGCNLKFELNRSDEGKDLLKFLVAHANQNRIDHFKLNSDKAPCRRLKTS